VLERVGRNKPCPCGSGRKYKHCHGVEGNIGAIPVRQDPGVSAGRALGKTVNTGVATPNTVALRRLVLAQPRLAFPEALPDLTPVERALLHNGIPEAEVYAFRKVGKLITPMNRSVCDPAMVKQWDEAVTVHKVAVAEFDRVKQQSVEQGRSANEQSPASSSPAPALNAAPSSGE
jgi:SEC-C motif